MTRPGKSPLGETRPVDAGFATCGVSGWGGGRGGGELGTCLSLLRVDVEGPREQNPWSY